VNKCPSKAVPSSVLPQVLKKLGNDVDADDEGKLLLGKKLKK
jgi:hypothetical protein